MHTVFVSSTYVDLTEHRAAVQSAIRQLGAVDISMENFGAREERPKEECLRIIREESNSFVGIYAHRYGFVPAGESKSITESEYDAAGQLPRFIYLVNEDVPWIPKFIDSEPAAIRLREFKNRLRASHICKTFSTKDELATSVAADLGRYLLRASLVRVADAGAAKELTRPTGSWSVEDWNKYRDGKYESNRDLFLVHSLAPSTTAGQLFDIFIYLQRHDSADISEVEIAEFFLGRYWGNRVFAVPNKGGPIGITVSAYGEFLCVCRVQFADGAELFLDRYINFAEYAR
jgi:hypothetical protein